LWIATRRFIKPNVCDIPPLKSDNVYLSTNVDKSELLAKTLKNTFSPNDVIDLETETMVYNKLAEPDILSQNILTYITPTKIIEIIKKITKQKIIST